MSSSSRTTGKEHRSDQYSNSFDRFDISKPPRKVKRETKRIRGEIACAECRRLKVRCDRVVPCSTCIKRGCAALCPNGTVPPGEGSRFVLAATDHLSRKMVKLEERMHSLEDALAIIHAATPGSDQPHPLLANHGTFEDDLGEENDERQNQDSTDLVDALGTLHIAEETGAVRFYGPSGGSETLLFNPTELADSSTTTGSVLHDIDPSYFPQEINLFYQSFPFTPPGIPTAPVQFMIESMLPPLSRATALSETFLEHLTWMTQIVSRQCVVVDLIPAVYNRSREGSEETRPYGPHELALLLTVLAIGALVDLSLPPYNSEGQHYYRLARAAFCLQPVMIKRSVVSVKALHLMSIYNGLTGKEGNLENAYFLLSFGAQAALMIGLHLDPSLWGIEGREAYDRRAYFWNLLAGDLWQGLVTGRPPVITSSFIDCRIPTTEEENTYQQGEVPLGFGTWGFRYTAECMIPVIEATLSAKPPSFRRILEIDSKIREFASPNPDVVSSSDRTSTSMRAFARAHYKELILLFLHRGFFARAMTDNPLDPSQSPYSHSFYTAYQCACLIVESTIEQFAQKPLLCARIWRIWSFCFSAAVIVGTVAARAPNVKLEPDPLKEFELACTLFESAARTNTRATRALPILLRIRQKAYQVRRQFNGGLATGVAPNSVQDGPDDELEIFGGKTRLVVPDRPSDLTPSATASEPSAPAATSASSYFASSISRLPNSPIDGMGSSRPPWRNAPLDSLGSLPPGWENLYREIPEPHYSNGPDQVLPGVGTASGQPEDGVILEDRWSSFMHNYSILGDVPQQTHN